MFSACIIEDDPGTLQALRTALNRLGCEVAISDDCEEGLEKIGKRNRVDIAFVSLSLRSASARKMAREIKTRHPASKIFFVTGWEGELDHRVLMSEGIAGVIRKPPRFREVKRALIQHLG